MHHFWRKASLFVELSPNSPPFHAPLEIVPISARFCPKSKSRARHDESMAIRATSSYPPPTLRLRRVLYQTGIADWSEGVVTEHDTDSGMVTILDTDDGSFWRGPEDLLEVIA